jgi:hypothetical protein
LSQAGILNDAGAIIPGSVAETFVTSAGTAIPVLNVLNVLGAIGSGNTVNIFAPNKLVNIFDDFLTTNSTSNSPGSLNWLQGSSNVFRTISGSATNPGQVVCSGNSNPGTICLADSQGSTGYPLVLGGGTYAVNWVHNLVTLSTGVNRYICQLGIMDTKDAVSQNGVYFSYSDNVNGGRWLLNCSSAGVTTSVDSGVAANTSFNNFGFLINAAGTSVSFTINGATVGTAITTNIPVLNISPMLKMLPTIGNNSASQTDLFYMQYILTTAR